MKTLITALAWLAVTIGMLSATAQAQTGQDIVLNYVWSRSDNPVATFNIKRAPTTYPVAACATATYTTIATISLKTYKDINPGVGSWCYKVTTTINTIESIDSNLVNVVMRPDPPVLGPATFAFVIDGIQATVTYTAKAAMPAAKAANDGKADKTAALTAEVR